MLSREDLKLLNELLHGGDLKTEEAEKLATKIALLCKQIEIMDKAQKDAAEIQDKIVALEGKDENKEK